MASPFVDEEANAPDVVSVSLNTLSPVLNLVSVLLGIMNTPETSPLLSESIVSIEYVEVASGVVVQFEETVATLVVTLYEEIVLSCPRPVPEVT